MTRQRVLITGASSGIGEEFAKLFASKGYDLVVIARRTERLTALQDELEKRFEISVFTIASDLAQPTAVEDICRILDENALTVDILINNAGYGLDGAFDERSTSEQVDMVRVNSLVPMELTHRLLPEMLERGYGRILFVASLAGALYGQGKTGVYVAAKTFIVRISLSLNDYYRPKNVFSSVILPGFITTDFHKRAGTEGLDKVIPGFAKNTATDIAREGYDMINRGVAYRVVGVANKLTALLIKYLPIGWGVKLMRSVA